MKESRAFTIVELLIVIVVIAILAAISIVAYNGIQQRSRASAASSAASQAKKKLEIAKIDNGEQYPSSLAAAGISNSGSTFYQYSSTGSTFCLTASVSGTSYNVSNSTGPSSGACLGQVEGGMVTNLAKNPSFETNTNFWFERYGQSIALSTDWANSGNSSILGIRNSSTITGVYIQSQYNASSYSDVIAGKTYAASAYVKSYGSLPTSGYFRIEWRDASDTNVGWSANTSIPVSANPQRVSATATAPTNAAYAVIWAVTNGMPIGSGMYVDSVMLSEGSTAQNYADGDSTDWIWNGTAHQSTSTGPAL